MAISVRSKFAGFLRGIIGRAEDRAPARPVAPTAALAPVPASRSTSQPAAAPASARPGNPDEIELPLASVLAGLPLDLRAKLMAAPPAGQTIHLQAEMVISQLGFGSVKISFGELRQLAPGIFVNSGGELDNKLISLPLQEILPRLNPTLLARRAAKKVEVADEIVGPFADRGRGFSFTTQPLKASPAPAPAPASEPTPAPPMAFVPPSSVRQVSSASSMAPVPQRSITPAPSAAGGNGNGHGNGHAQDHSLPVSPLSPRSITPAPGTGNGSNGHAHTNGNGNGNGHSNGHSNGNGNGNGHGNGHGQALPPGLRLGPMSPGSRTELPPLKMSAAPAPSMPAPAAPTPAAAPAPAPAQPTIFASLSDLCENWPGELKTEILASPLAQASVPLDGAVILPGLKRGRVMMTWKQLRILAQPSSPASPKDNLELELPLKVVAPLFLAAQKNPGRLQAKAAVSAEIPDLFFGFPQPAPAPVPVVVPPLPKVQDTNFYGWGEKTGAPPSDEAGLRRGEAPQTDFLSRQAHPKDVVARATSLPGVAGSVVAMQDGLRVASQVPADLNADTLAAFLPQIFERVNQSTRELRMGALNNLNFTVGNVPWKIFRVNSVYFAAFGRTGEQLPSGQLAQLAAELDRKKQQ